MKPGQPKAIIFDCWNTLFYVSIHPGLLNRLSHRLLHHKLTYPLIKRFELSLMTQPDRDARLAAQRLMRDLRLPRMQLLAEWVAASIDHDPDRQRVYRHTFQVLKELRERGYKLAMITNTYELTFAKLRDERRLDDYFDVIMPSYEVGVIKPNPKIFELTLQKLGVKASEAVMVGDNLRDDVQAAESVGMRGILIDRRNWNRHYQNRITSLAQLPDRIQSLI
jgi:2-haloalkanoic acid dehalogenase type II